METAINKLKFNLLELNKTGWGLGVNAPARVTTEKWVSAINVSKQIFDLVDANALTRSLVVIGYVVSIQRISLSLNSLLKFFEGYSIGPSFESIRYTFYGLEIVMDCVSEELTKCYNKCKQQSHL